MASGGSGKGSPQGRGSRRLTLQGSLAAADGYFEGTSSKFANLVDFSQPPAEVKQNPELYTAFWPAAAFLEISISNPSLS